MAKINPQIPQAPAWPWGGPRVVRDRLVNRGQLDNKKSKKKGDPKNPSLASAALLDFIGPAHSAEELRLPMPALPEGHESDLAGFTDRPHLGSVAARADEQTARALQHALGGIKAAPDRVDRLKALLQREAQMLELVGQLHEDVEDIARRRSEEQAEEGF